MDQHKYDKYASVHPYMWVFFSVVWWHLPVGQSSVCAWFEEYQDEFTVLPWPPKKDLKSVGPPYYSGSSGYWQVVTLMCIMLVSFYLTKVPLGPFRPRCYLCTTYGYTLNVTLYCTATKNTCHFRGPSMSCFTQMPGDFNKNCVILHFPCGGTAGKLNTGCRIPYRLQLIIGSSSSRIACCHLRVG